MSTTLSSISGALKNVYDKYSAENQQNLKTLAIDGIAKSLTKYSNGGNGFYGAINDYGNEAGGALNETEAFRTIDNENYVQWKVTPKVQYWPIEFSGLAAAAADTNEEAFVGVVVDALDKAKERLLKDENRQFFGLGTGLLASPTATNSSAVTSFTVDNTQYLRDNMVVDIYTGATLTCPSIRISKVDRTTGIVYFATSIIKASDATCQIVKEGIRANSPAADGKEMMGLRGIVDDSTDLTTFQSIDATGSYVWRGRRISSATNLTSDLLQRLIDDVAVLSGEEPDKLYMHRKQRRKYLDIVVPQKRYADGNMDTGFKDLTFNGYALELDYDCQTDTVYAVKTDKLRKFELEALAMGKHEGSDTFLRTSGYDKFQAYWRHYCNFGTSQRNAHGKITGLTVPTGIA